MHCMSTTREKQLQLCLAVLQSHSPSTKIRRDVGLCTADIQTDKCEYLKYA